MKKDTNLVWIDTEFTGLEGEPKLLEIAMLITDKNLKVLNNGLEIVVHQKEEVLEKMSDWCKQNLEGELLMKVKESDIDEKKAETMLFLEIEKYCNPKKSLLCGNSLWWDKFLLIKYMPKVIDYLHYRIIDVTTIKELYRRWYLDKPEFVKPEGHRALDDIYQSLAELKFYRDNIFK